MRTKPSVRPAVVPFFSLMLVAMLFVTASSPADAACPSGLSYPVTSGDPAAGPRIVLTGLGAHPEASFFLLGSGDDNNSGGLSAADWLKPVGDIDGDGLPDWIVDAPGTGAGGWGDPRTNGCPAFANPPNPPIVILIHHPKEDLDFLPRGGDGKFDVYEDFRPHNGVLDPLEDLDGDGHLTPEGGCEGLTREDQDCDHHLDSINEDDNHNGRLDPGEDRDGDGRLDDGTEDRNGNARLDDRPDPAVDNNLIPDETGHTGNFYPYGSARPSRGGVVVISVAWNGSAYDLQALNTPTTLLRPNEDLDHDGKFDVDEDFRPHNGLLDPGEDVDGDGHLTPPGGCEGVNREDKDCDHHLDVFDEDNNHNGVLDPGEDLDGDGRLDNGTEDRNHNFQLDDRPDPAAGNDEIPDESGAVGHFYPYGTPFPGPFRVAAATPLEDLQRRADGTRLDPYGHLRLSISSAGVALNDDAGGSRPVFDAALLSFFDGRPCIEFGLPPRVFCPTPTFASNGVQTVRIPSASNLAFESFQSILPFGAEVGPMRVLAQSAGSEAFLGAHWPSLPLPNLLDDDFDHDLYAAYPGEVVGPPSGPAWSPMDICPHLFSEVNHDDNHDGIGDRCDPAWPSNNQVAPNRWSPAGDGTTPGVRDGAAAVFDAARGVVVLFGGAYDSSTWEFDGAWHQRITGPAPEPRRAHRMVYDAGRGRVVLYGGERLSDGTLLGDQWDYDGAAGAWTRLSPAVSPGPRSGFGMAYDAGHQAIVLYGGRRGAGLLGDTWVSQGGVWRLVPLSRTPGPRADAAMTWDGFRKLTVLVGGTGPSSPLNDAWEFDGTSWEPVDALGELPPTATAVGSFDAARRQVLLFGGDMQIRGSLVSMVSRAVAPTAATRSFDGRRFTPLPSRDTTAARSRAAAAFDAAHDRLLVQGGMTVALLAIDDSSLLEQPADTDADGVPDAADNCPRVTNAAQEDTDGDGSGDLCDDCPLVSNSDQRDRDGDGLGDACDPDRDGDGIVNAADACPDSFVPGRPDSAILGGGGPDGDGDGIADDCDACPADPHNDLDGDGLCGDEDNCPATANTMQTDTNGDGAGDACQPAVKIVSILPSTAPPHALEARVVLGDPDGDKPFGTIQVAPAGLVPEVVTAQKDPCAYAFLPDGNAGEGIVYAFVPSSPPLLADVDSNVGCGDGMVDYTLSFGACAEGAASNPVLILDRPVPFPICVRGSHGAHDYVVERISPTEVVIAAGLPPVLSVDYQKGRLPHSINLQGLPAPGPYILTITAGDGTTPPVSDLRLFDWNSEKTMILTQGGRKNLAPVSIRDRRVY